jgi:DNA-directed RNA polymerase specialized sigma24 family protein
LGAECFHVLLEKKDPYKALASQGCLAGMLVQGKRLSIKNRTVTSANADRVVRNDDSVVRFEDLITNPTLFLWPDEKELLRQRYLLDRTQQEIALRLGIRESNISVRMTKIKQKIRKQLTTGGQS